MTLTPTSVSVVNIPASSLSFPNDIYTWFNISPIRQIAPPTINALRQFNHPFDFGVMFSTYLLYISFCLFLSFSFKTAPIPGSLLFFSLIFNLVSMLPTYSMLPAKPFISAYCDI